MIEIDDSDRKILRCIQENPDITMRELGDATGMSHSPCWRRLQRLKELGVVGDKSFHIYPEAVGYEIRVLCFVRIAEHKRDQLQAFETAVQNVPEILQCYSLSGEYDYVLHVIARSVRDYEDTVKNALVELPNVQSINTSFTLKTVKDSRVVPV
ncbi:Lrp/AsnC family transcriptional regulator [Aquamicrobium terrae]